MRFPRSGLTADRVSLVFGFSVICARKRLVFGYCLESGVIFLALNQNKGNQILKIQFILQMAVISSAEESRDVGAQLSHNK